MLFLVPYSPWRGIGTAISRASAVLFRCNVQPNYHFVFTFRYSLLRYMATSSFTRKPIPEALDVKKEQLENMLKRRMFYCPSFEIYGGVAGLYDYGPPGCALKANLLSFWRQHFVLEENMLEVDCTSLTPAPVLKASGHVDKFTDFMVKDVKTGACFRADHLLKAHMERLLKDPALTPEKRQEYNSVIAQKDEYNQHELGDVLRRYGAKAPETGNDITDPLPFNLMFATSIGPTGAVPGFLRPETAQGIFVNFKRLLEYNGGKIPFAAAQIGQAFRNEISPRAGLFRVREFTLAEIEHFCKADDKRHPKFSLVAGLTVTLFPRTEQTSQHPALIETTLGEAVAKGIIANETLAYFMGRTHEFLVQSGIRREGLRFRQHLSNEMAHYASDCWDAEVLTSSGWIEVVGHADRSCFDLTQHSNATHEALRAYEEYPDGARVVTTYKVTPNKGAIGTTFRADSKVLLSYLEGLPDNPASAAELATKLETEGKVTLSLSGKEFTLDSNMLKIAKVEEKRTGEFFTPHVIEPSYGIGRIVYAILEHTFYVRPSDEQRGVLRLPPVVAPVRCSVLPLHAKDERLAPITRQITMALTAAGISNKIDDAGQQIGRRYARTDEIGIPFGVTVDFTTLTDNTVTLRERDSMLQIRVPISELAGLVSDLIAGRTTWENARAKYPHQEPVADE